MIGAHVSGDRVCARPAAVGAKWNDLQVAKPPELVCDFPQERARQVSQRAHESPIVDRGALVNPGLARCPGTRNAPGKRHPQEALPRQPSRARQDPRRWMSDLVEEVCLDHEHWSNLAGFTTLARLEIGQVECVVPDS